MNYRGINFSVADNRDGTWRWQLHPEIVPNVARGVPSGQVTGKQPDAINAAHAAINDWLAAANHPK